jgi:hypothetical protein
VIVFIAGMQRSGSTFAFNLARELLSRTGTVHAEPSMIIQDVLARSGGADHVVLKAHIPDALLISLVRHGAVKTICTYRATEDSVASLMDTFGFDLDNSIARVRAWCRMYSAIRRSSLNIPYEAVRHRPESVGSRVAAHLGIVADAAAIARIYSRERAFAASHAMTIRDPDVVNLGFTFFHRETYLHRRHVSSLRDRVASRELPVADLNRIRAALSDEIAFLNRCATEDEGGDDIRATSSACSLSPDG